MKKVWIYTRGLVIRVGAAIGLLAAPAQASLMVSGVYVTDTATNLEFVSPFATRQHSYNQVIGGYGGYLADGFSVASYAIVRAMIVTNFNNPAVLSGAYLGDAAGYTEAGQFFTTFGINENLRCQIQFNGPLTPCPRTQGMTEDGGLISQLGMLQISGIGGMIDAHNNLTVAQNGNFTDLQLGVWLVKSAASSAVNVPEPASAALLIVGILALTTAVRRRHTIAA